MAGAAACRCRCCAGWCSSATKPCATCGAASNAGREALESVREAAGQRVQQLVGSRRRKGRKTPSLLEELLEAPQRTLDELQHRIDAQVRQSVERVTSHPTLRKEIQRIERSLRQLEQRIGQIAQGRRTKPPAKAKRAKR